MTEEGKLRVWWIRNPPRKADMFHVESIEAALKKLAELGKEDLADDSVNCNAGGLEIYSEECGWSEWYNNEGDDIGELMK
jgi:hypothetical protein